MSDPIPVPKSVAQRIQRQYQQVQKAQRRLQDDVDLVAQTAGVPDGYEYVFEKGAFVPKNGQQEATE